MTDSNDPTRRRRPHREPAILDLKATVVDEGRAPAPSAATGEDGLDPPAPDAPAAGEAASPNTPDATAASEEAPPNALTSATEPGDASAVHGAAWPDASAMPNEGPTSADAASSTPLGATAHDAPGADLSPQDGERPKEGDSVDPTVPVSDADFTPPPSGSVPPIAAAPTGRDEPARRGAGFGSLLTAGVLGGLIGAGALYGLQTLRPARPVEDPRIAEIQQRLAALPRNDAAQGLERRIAALETAQTDIGQRLGAAQSLAERAAARAEEAANRPATPGAPAASAAPATAAAPPASGAPATAAAPLASGAPATAAAPAANPAALNDLNGRLAALEGQVRNPPPAVADLTNRLGTLERQIGERVQANTTATQALERRLAESAGATQGLERRLQESATATQGLEQRLGQNDQRIAELQRQLAQWSPQAVQAGLRAVLAGRLNDALAQGAPYADILGGLRRFEADPARVQALEPLAASGAPTAAALQQEFRPLAERIVRDTRGEADTLAERLLRMADRVVTVRAIDDPAFNAVPAVVTRIENALARGALADAAAAWDSLPEPARQISAAWGQRLKARVAAEQAARAIASDSVAALSAAPR